MTKNGSLSADHSESCYTAEEAKQYAQEEAEQYDLLTSDFRNFLYAAYVHMGLEVDPITYEIAEYLQTLYEDRTPGMVQAMRGIGKSYVTSCFAAWVLRRNSNEKILVVSGREQKALEFIAMTQNLIMELPFLSDLRPNKERGFDVKRQRWSQTQFDVYGCDISQAPSVRAASITGQLTGSRATLIISDDIETPENSRTITQREKIVEAMREFEAIRLPGSFEIFLGTPQCEDTLYTDLCKHIRLRQWPAEYPTAHDRDTLYSDLAPSISAEIEKHGDAIAGKAVVPVRYSDKDLIERRERNGLAWYKLHFLLDPSMSDADRHPLKLNDLIVHGVNDEECPAKIVWGPEEWRSDLPCVGLGTDRYTGPKYCSDRETGGLMPYETKVIAVDPSGRGADETGVAVIGSAHGNLYLLHSEGINGTYEESMQRISNLAGRFGVHRIVVEGNFGDGMFEKLLQPVLMKDGNACRIESVKVTSAQGRKEERIANILEPVLSQHRLTVTPSVIKSNYRAKNGPIYDLFFQMSRMTREKGCLKHDDRLDALALGVGWLTEHLGRDRDSEAERRAERLRNDLEEDMARMYNRGSLNEVYRRTFSTPGSKDLGPENTKATARGAGKHWH